MAQSISDYLFVGWCCDHNIVEKVWFEWFVLLFGSWTSLLWCSVRYPKGCYSKNIHHTLSSYYNKQQVNMKAVLLQLLIGGFVISSHCISAFVSVAPKISTDRFSNRLPIRRVDLQHLDSSSSSSTALGALQSLNVAAAATSVSGFYQAFPLLAGFLTW